MSHEVDEIECFIDKNNCSTCGAPLRTTELTFPEHHLNEVMHTATDGRNGLFAPLLSRLRFAAIRGDLLISDTRISGTHFPVPYGIILLMQEKIMGMVTKTGISQLII